MIKKGSKIKIKNNLLSVLEVLNYKQDVINYLIERFKTGEYIVEDVWYNQGQYFVVIDGSCEIPIQCCEEVK